MREGDHDDMVRAILRKSKFPASEEEVKQLVSTYGGLLVVVQSLYAQEFDETPPGVRFVADTTKDVDRDRGANAPDDMWRVDAKKMEGTSSREAGTLTLFDLATRLREGELSSASLTRGCFEQADAVDENLGVYVTRFDEQAMEAALRADKELEAGRDRGPLHGIPIGVKDVISTVESPTTAQSLVSDPNWGDGVDAPVVTRLRRKGAVIVGKTTTSEFALGLPDATKPFNVQPFPVPRNPWDPDRWAGGSSAGSASGLVAGVFMGSVGTDTCGSIRLPAAFCGVSGLKPTFGLVAKAGCLPLGFSLDCVGPMARTAHDCALLLEAIAGWDEHDPDSVGSVRGNYAADLDRPIEGLRIGIESERHRGADVEPSVKEALEAVIELLAGLGATIVEVSLKSYEAVDAAAWLIMLSEGLAYHRRRLQDRWWEYGAPTRTALATGAFYDAADYVQAQRLRSVAKRDADALFEKCDVLISPTVRCGASPLGVNMAELSQLLFTAVWSAVGFPALSVPMGFDGEGMPLGLQVIARPFHEGLVLHVAHKYQELTDWHLRVPNAGMAGD